MLHALKMNPPVAASCAAGLLLLTGLLCPIWTVWVDYRMECNGDQSSALFDTPGTLLDLLEWLPTNVSACGDSTSLRRLHADNLIRAGLLLGMATGVGYGVFWWMRRCVNRVGI